MSANLKFQKEGYVVQHQVVTVIEVLTLGFAFRNLDESSLLPSAPKSSYLITSRRGPSGRGLIGGFQEYPSEQKPAGACRHVFSRLVTLATTFILEFIQENHSSSDTPTPSISTTTDFFQSNKNNVSSLCSFDLSRCRLICC